MPLSKSITPLQAAPKIGMAQKALEQWLRTGKCPFGIYLKKEDKQRGEYIIFETRLKAFIEGEDMKGLRKCN